MIQPNFIVLLLTALIPLVVGFIWYNKSVFGTAWMKATDMTEEKQASGPKMPVVFILTYVFSFLLAFSMQFIVIHQAHLYSIVMGDPALKDPNSELSMLLKNFMENYGNNYRTFKHGALHGTIGGVFIALPILAINALFEKRSGKYIAINGGYWIVSMALMGGLFCAFTYLLISHKKVPEKFFPGLLCITIYRLLGIRNQIHIQLKFIVNCLVSYTFKKTGRSVFDIVFRTINHYLGNCHYRFFIHFNHCRKCNFISNTFDGQVTGNIVIISGFQCSFR